MRSKTKLITLIVGSIVTLSLFLAPLAIFIPLAKATVSWSKYSGDLTMDNNERYVADAWVIKDGSNYKMWYTHINTDVSVTQIYNDVKNFVYLDDLVVALYNLDEEDFLNNLTDLGKSTTVLKNIGDGSSAVIGYATSLNGKDWTVEKRNALVGNTGGAWTSVGTPCVIKDDTAPASQRYKMWYTGVETTLTEAQVQTILTNLGIPAQRSNAATSLLNSTYTYIGYATSSDGINWTNQGGVFALTGGTWTVLNSVGAPCVIKDGSTYKMWYTRIKTDVTQALLDSVLADIANFSIDELLDLLDGTATVIGYAESDNGVTGWTIQDPEVLPVSTPIWESVGDPCVIKSEGTYEMWYTNSDVSLIKANLNNLIGHLRIVDTPALWTSLQTKGLAAFLTDVLDEAAILDLVTIKSLVTGSHSTVGYATSSDGTNWNIVSAENLTGRGDNPWGSAAAPSVIKVDTRYHMWYTDGTDDVTWQNFFDLAIGTDLPIGYATYDTAAKPRTGGAGTPPGTTKVSHKVTSTGHFTDTVTATSSDSKCGLTIPEGTQGLDENGRPLKEITIVPMDDPPPPPEQANVIGLTYEFGPEGATFDPPITITFTYDESLIPEGIDEETLVIAVWNPDTNEWVELVCTVDPDTNTITAQISHFSIFTVIISTRPAAFAASNLSISPSEVDIGEIITISARVTNTGDFSGTYEVTLEIDDVVVETTEVTLAGGARRTVTFTTSRDAVGTYAVSIDGLSGTFSVREATAPPPPPPPPAPAAFTTGNLLIAPAEVDIGKTVTISAKISNTGDLEGKHRVTLKVNDIIIATQDVIRPDGNIQS